MRHLRLLWIGLAAFSLANFAVAAWDLGNGGFHFTLLGIRISSWELFKPLGYAIVTGMAAFWVRDLSVDAPQASWNALPRWSPSIAAGTAAAFVAIAVTWNGFAAGGPDGYGYVSQAIHLSHGYTAVPDPVASLAPVIGPAATPIAYTLARTPGRLAPIYSPGFPLVMALALRIAGMRAIFLIAPLFGGLAVWLTYRLAKAAVDGRAAAIAAILFGFSPLLLFNALTPMSDVPATAWWLLSLVFAIRTGSGSALAAGLAASAALLTRPNLVPIALVLALVILARDGIGRATAFGAGVLPACVAVAGLDLYLRGSPLRSGYGTPGELFKLEFVPTNTRHYLSWLFQLYTPAILISALGPATTRLKFSLPIAAFVGAVVVCYIFYLPFDHWTFLRFLLPAIPILFISGAAVIVSVLERLPAPLRTGLAFAVCVAGSCWFIATGNRMGFFEVNRGEQRYITIGRAAERFTPPNAAMISLIHSGNVRLYGNRTSVRWDLIEPDRLQSTVDALRAHGYAPYILLEDWEEPEFRDRFGRGSALGRLDWPPRFEFIGHVQVRLYAFEDRERYLHGEHLLPHMIPG